jgi:hypothetical protein
VKQKDDDMFDDQLHELLQQSPDREPSAALMRTVAEIPLRHPHEGMSWLPFGGFRRWAMVLAAALAMGAAFGVAFPDAPGKTASEELATDDDGYDALSTVALGADLSEELSP